MTTMPVDKGFYVTSHFGNRDGGFHWGTDYGKDGGSGGCPVYAVKDGTVTRAGAADGFGSWVTVDHPAGNGGGETIYGHVIPEVKAGQQVREGQRIARINPDSRTNGGVAPHLHMEWHRYVWVPPGGDRLNPAVMLTGAKWPGTVAPLPAKKPAPAPATPLLINGDPVDADWAAKFNFGNPRSTNGLIGVCIHTTENPIGAPAEGVAGYQINTESGSYHVLVDNTTNDNINSLRENTDDWETWSAGPKGNQIALHVSFVAYSASTRGQWLAADRMLNEGADVVAYWCKRYGFPVAKINGNDLRAGKRGLFGHGDVSAAWREVDHTDPGPNFPWDVFLRKVNDRINPKHKENEVDKAQADRIERKLDDIITQLAGMPERDGKQLWRGWPQLGQRTPVDAIAGIGAYLGLPGYSDVKKQIQPPKHGA